MLWTQNTIQQWVGSPKETGCYYVTCLLPTTTNLGGSIYFLLTGSHLENDVALKYVF